MERLKRKRAQKYKNAWGEDLEDNSDQKPRPGSRRENLAESAKNCAALQRKNYSNPTRRE